MFLKSKSNKMPFYKRYGLLFPNIIIPGMSLHLLVF